ncbi:MAG: hypothetical protein Q9217_002949 [Psora testacea]
MGVPLLLKRFQHYSTRSTLGCTQPGCQEHDLSDLNSTTKREKKVIIDGPCLAFFIYNRLLAHKPGELGPVDCQPSYEEIGKGVLAFLRQLEACGLQIDRIYFDGYLPESKRDTRFRRLDQGLSDLASFHATHREGLELSDDACNLTFELHSASDDTVAERVFQQKPRPVALRGTQSASFLVPAVLETLLNSKFAEITTLVPGEADPYCARRARRESGIVLTSDSDLIIHDLGWSGSVVYLAQLELHILRHGKQNVLRLGKQNATPCTFLQAPIFEPHYIANKLHLPDLVGLGYFMAKHPTKSVQDILQTIHISLPYNSRRDLPDDLPTFEALYRTMPASNESQNFDTKCLQQFRANRKVLDPRLSEVVLQFASTNTECVDCFLPPLIDDPSRVSAWEASAKERSFAYACLSSWCTPENSPTRRVEEHSRKGQRYIHQRSGVDAWVDRPDWLSTYAKLLCQSCEKVARHFRVSDSNMYWRLVGLTQVLNWYEGKRKPFPNLDVIGKAVTGVVERRWMWKEVHLSAQIQAALYSLRMIKQAMEYSCAKDTRPNFSPPVKLLFETLQKLPPLRLLMATRMELQNKASNVRLDELLMETRNYLQEYIDGSPAGDEAAIACGVATVVPFGAITPQYMVNDATKENSPKVKRQGKVAKGKQRHSGAAASHKGGNLEKLYRVEELRHEPFSDDLRVNQNLERDFFRAEKKRVESMTAICCAAYPVFV